MYKGLARQHSGGCMMVVRRKDKDGVEFVCSGFLCHNKGYILTCAHSLNLTDKLAIIPPQPFNEFNQLTLTRVQVFDVTIAQYDPQNDIALLKISNQTPINVPPNMFGNESTSDVGASVGYMGFPFGHSGLHTLKVSQSIISSKVLSNNGTKQYQIDAMVHEGNSGGPLIDLKSGRIIGVISGRFNPTANGASIMVGNHALGTESFISYATSVIYGTTLMKDEGLDV